MEMKTLFSIPVGISNHKEILSDARKLFEHEELFGLVKDGEVGPHWTSLRGYGKRVPTPIPDCPETAAVKKVIIEEVTEFAKQFGYDVEKYDFEVANLWMNIMHAGAVHTQHAHFGHTFSGCIYVDIPANSGFIKFTTPNKVNKSSVDVKDWTPHASTEWTLDAKDGDIIIWESYLPHTVPAMAFEGSRLTMAFDVDVYFKED